MCVQEDGWDTEPFELVEKDGKLFGRGSTDDKGPVIGWVHAIEAYQATGALLPVNMKVIPNNCSGICNFDWKLDNFFL